MQPDPPGTAGTAICAPSLPIRPVPRPTRAAKPINERAVRDRDHRRGIKPPVVFMSLVASVGIVDVTGQRLG